MENENNFVVAISSNIMGQGDETLGKTILKAFIFTLTKQKNLPKAMVFYNKGAYLTTEGTESFDDLKALENAGVKILTCGTCLEYYNLKDKVVIGEISNMYDIVEAMENANKVIRP